MQMEQEIDISNRQAAAALVSMSGPQPGRLDPQGSIEPSEMDESYTMNVDRSSSIRRTRTDARSEKTNDSDNVVTAVTSSTAQASSLSTAQASSSSSECQEVNQTTTTSNTTTASSGSGGDDDDRGEHLSASNGGIKGDCNMGSMKRNENGSGSVKERSNHDRQEKRKHTSFLKTNRDGLSPRKKFRHQEEDDHHQKSWEYTGSNDSLSPTDDGSTLQVPGDDGSDRIVAGDVQGGVPRKPATVVASRIFPPYKTAVNSNSSASSSTLGNGVEAQNQHHLLLPPHREPGYHTIRNTLYRFQSSDSNSNSNPHGRKRGKKHSRGTAEGKDSKNSLGSTDVSSNEDLHKEISPSKVPKCSRHHHRHHHHRHAGSSSASENSKHKRKRLRPGRSSIGLSPTSNGTGKMNLKDSNKPPARSSLIKVRNSGGSSSGSGTDGTEDGYAGSVSSNENGSGNHQHGSSSPSPSFTSSEEGERDQQEGRHKRKSNNSKRKSSVGPDSSSEIADFSSSGSSETMDVEDVGESRQGRNIPAFGMKTYTSSSSPSLSSSNYTDSDGLERAYLSAKRDADAEHARMFKMFARKKKSRNSNVSGSGDKSLSSQSTRLTVTNLDDGRPPVIAMGCDIMAHILTFLQPPEILDVLTMPLSKQWRQNFTSQPELWRVLCLVEPFKASVDDPAATPRSKKYKSQAKRDSADSSSDESYDCMKKSKDKDTEKGSLGKYRLLYTSFVRCMKYISQIQDDAINGRPPAYIDYGVSSKTVNGAPEMFPFSNANRRTNRSLSNPPPPGALGSNINLQLFLAQARDVVLNSTSEDAANSAGETKVDVAAENQALYPILAGAARVGTAHKKSERTAKKNIQDKKEGPKFGRSMITRRLFGSASPEEPGNLNLPWSCAIYSIVNWMVAFSDVEGLQILCMKVLPVLLENEQHRLTAQHAGLADVVLRAMVIFSESVQLHIAAFHTIVLLARPHGGREGMMFRTSMTSGGIFRGIYQQHGKSGIAVMLDSMRRFQNNTAHSAMSCWALVNIALVSDQKAVLVKLGGVQAITNAMYRHPYSAELQFRALFALINLVIPSVDKVENDGNENFDDGNANADSNDDGNERSTVRQESELGELNETTEREIIDELVGDIASLVVRVMKNFCSSEAILNRACLVLHNLSLTDDYHPILLWTPHCYQMLEWCIGNFRTDQVLQQSATGTLHRLQSTLAADDNMRSRFTKTLRDQQQQITLKATRDQER